MAERNMSLRLLDAITDEASASGRTREEVLRDAIDQLLREKAQMARDEARTIEDTGKGGTNA